MWRLRIAVVCLILIGGCCLLTWAAQPLVSPESAYHVNVTLTTRDVRVLGVAALAIMTGVAFFGAWIAIGVERFSARKRMQP